MRNHVIYFFFDPSQVDSSNIRFIHHVMGVHMNLIRPLNESRFCDRYNYKGLFIGKTVHALKNSLPQ